MSAVIEWSDPCGLSPSVRRLRAHAAVVRTLLDELDRAAPALGRGVEEATASWRAEDLAEELAHLARRMTECAAVAALLAASHFAEDGHGASSSAASGTDSAPTKVDERGESGASLIARSDGRRT